MASFAGGDSHDLWIDPDDTNHVLHASDSGGAVTFNASTQPPAFTARDYPTGQFYHVITTRHIPYHVCGAQQDASTVCVPSDTNLGGASGGRGGGGAWAAGAAGVARLQPPTVPAAPSPATLHPILKIPMSFLPAATTARS